MKTNKVKKARKTSFTRALTLESGTVKESFETPPHRITAAIRVNSLSKHKSSFAHFICRLTDLFADA